MKKTADVCRFTPTSYVILSSNDFNDKFISFTPIVSPTITSSRILNEIASYVCGKLVVSEKLKKKNHRKITQRVDQLIKCLNAYEAKPLATPTPAKSSVIKPLKFAPNYALGSRIQNIRVGHK